MNKLLKDIIEVSYWGLTILGGLIVAFLAIRQFKLNTEQRKDELRWKQANAAKEIINDIHNNKLASNAVFILDWSEGRHRLKFEDKDSVIISYIDDVIPALNKPQSKCSELDQDIIYCFDWFFYYINRIEHYIRTNLIKFEDVEDIHRLYSKKIKEHEAIYEKFMDDHSYNLANHFWKRPVLEANASKARE
jgi:hypothetical protein